MAGVGRRRIGIACALGLAALAIWYAAGRMTHAPVTSSNSGASNHEVIAEKSDQSKLVEPAKSDAPVAKSSWPIWGEALNSAEFSGRSFFDRRQRRAFEESIDPSVRKYVVNLNARSFLPLVAESKDALAKAMFPDDAQTKADETRVVYMQFLDHPTDAQKALLKQLGVTLLLYMDGYAWTAQGEPAALLAAADQPFFRAMAEIDPRDKLLAPVYAQQTPAYALAPDGSTRFRVLAVPGTTAELLSAQWAASPDLAALTVKAGSPSVLGPRFEVSAPAALAARMASASRVACIEYTAPPVASRDATTDSSSNITLVRDQGDKLDGTGVTVAVREIGLPEQHVDFTSRMTYIDMDGDNTTVDVYEHATEVVGQIASSGVNFPVAKGVAPNCNILVYSVPNATAFSTADVIDAATNHGSRLSNHSYGPVTTTFGDYESDSANWDAAIQANNLICFFAGNENQPNNYIDIDFFVGMKNGLCIEASSAMANAGNSTTAQSDGSAYFAQYGPMADGRVKPDLVAFGDGVTLDVGAGANSTTTTNTGTSFSTPASTGIGTLVFQRYSAVFGSQPSAALTKALLCETASNLGADIGLVGPSAIYGFGIINASAAVGLIDLHAANSSAVVFVENTIANGGTQSYQIAVPANTPVLKTTACWMDQPGNPTAAKALINDLDMLLIDPNGVQYYPYSLSATNPSLAATNFGPNRVDPIEQTIVTNPVAGIWTVTITGYSVPMGPQAFALCTNIPLNTGLSASASASPTTGPSPLTVFFSGAASSGAIATYTWNFGDGTTGTGATISHTYNTGTYTATLTVTDSSGRTSTSSGITIVVTSSTLKALAVAVPTSGPAPLTVQFSGGPSNGNITNYIWDFGDNTFGSGVQISHVYALGTYTAATLTVTDTFGHSDVYAIPQITATKQLDSTPYPLLASGKVNLNTGKLSSNQLSVATIVQALVMTPQQSRLAVENGTFEGMTYTVRAGLAGGPLTTLYTFLANRHLTEFNPAESFKVNLRTGTADAAFKNVPNVHDLAQLFKSFGITETTTSLQFTMRVQIETASVIYQSDYTMVYKGNAGAGTIKGGGQ